MTAHTTMREPPLERVYDNRNQGKDGKDCRSADHFIARADITVDNCVAWLEPFVPRFAEVRDRGAERQQHTRRDQRVRQVDRDVPPEPVVAGSERAVVFAE